MIKKYLLDNQKQLYVILKPDKNFLNDQSKNEKALLQKLESSLNEEKIKTIKEENEILLRHQNSIQDMIVLPSLQIKDIPEATPKTNIRTVKVEGTDVHFVNDVPKGLTTIRLKINITNFPPAMSNYLFLL